MFLAPLMVVLVPLVIVLWPPVLVLTGIAWLLVWPFARVMPGAHRWLGESFRTLLTPWTYFDAPKKTAVTPVDQETEAPRT